MRSRVKARVVVFNFRGRGGLGLKNPRTYCAANSDDLSEILDFLKSEYPKAPLVALGISLGTNFQCGMITYFKANQSEMWCERYFCNPPFHFSTPEIEKNLAAGEKNKSIWQNIHLLPM